MLRLTILNSLSYLFKPKNENLYTNLKLHFSHDYSHKPIYKKSCQNNEDCNINEICLSGYCSGLNRKYNLHGIFIDNEYKNILENPHPLYFYNIDNTIPLFKDKLFFNGNILQNHEIQEHELKTDSEYDYDYE
jgi:hypothetical protein